jgi:hypothetical protein
MHTSAWFRSDPSGRVEKLLEIHRGDALLRWFALPPPVLHAIGPATDTGRPGLTRRAAESSGSDAVINVWPRTVRQYPWPKLVRNLHLLNLLRLLLKFWSF